MNFKSKGKSKEDIRIKLEQANATDIKHAMGLTKEKEALNAPIIPQQFKGQVLLADDMPEVQMFLRSILSDHGILPELVSNGREVLNKTQSKTYDLIFMDMQMPVLDGFETVKILRDKAYGGPIVALTANLTGNRVQDCIRVGCNDCLGKPFTRQALSLVLFQYLEKVIDENHSVHDSSFQDAASEFVSSFDKRIDELERTCDKSDFAGLAKMAHYLGGAAVFCYADVYLSLAELELASGNRQQACPLLIAELRKLHSVLQGDFAAQGDPEKKRGD